MSNELIQELCNTPGLIEGLAIINILLANYSESIKYYKLLFQINEKTPNLPTILIDAHMDEVGFIISHIEENGMLRVIPLGGIDPKLFYGQRLTIWGKKRIEATVAAIPPHISDKNSPNITSVEDCLIDTGINIKKIKEIVSIGDQVTFSTECVIDIIYVILHRDC